MSLSTRQQNILDFIRRFSRDHGFPPTIREIGEQVGISSTSVVSYNLNALEKKNRIERDKNVSRGLRLVERSRAAQPVGRHRACASAWGVLWQASRSPRRTRSRIPTRRLTLLLGC